MENKTWFVIIGILAVLAFGIYAQKQTDLFALLPDGEYAYNADCTFITNVNYGANGEQIDDYSSGSWVVAKLNGNSMEYFKYSGTNVYSSTSGCDSRIPILLTPGGLKVYKFDSNGVVLGICSGNTVKKYNMNANTPPTTTCDGDNSNAKVCDSWDSAPCINGYQTIACHYGWGGQTTWVSRTCSLPSQCSISSGNECTTCEKYIGAYGGWLVGDCDMNLLLSCTAKLKTYPTEFSRVTPSGNTYYCSNGACVTFSQLVSYGSQWKSGQITFAELINYAVQWKTC